MRMAEEEYCHILRMLLLLVVPAIQHLLPGIKPYTSPYTVIQDWAFQT